MRIVVGRSRYDAQAARAGRDGGWPDALNEKASFEQLGRELHRSVRIADDDGDDGGRAVHRDIPALGRQCGSQSRRVACEACATVVGDFDESERFADHRGQERRNGGREDVAACTVLEQGAKLRSASDEGPCETSRLSESADQGIGANTQVVGKTATGADDAERMRFVDEKTRFVRVAEPAKCRKGRGVAIHREEAVGDDPGATSLRAMSAQQVLEVVGVGVIVDVHRGAAEAEAIDQARMVEAIAEGDVAPSKESRERTDVGGVAAGEEERRGEGDPCGEGAFGLEMDAATARDEPGCAGTDSMFGQRGTAALDEARVVGETEIVVRAEEENGAAINVDEWTVGRFEGVGTPQKTSALQLEELGAEDVEDGHGAIMGAGRRCGNTGKKFHVKQRVPGRLRARPSALEPCARRSRAASIGPNDRSFGAGEVEPGGDEDPGLPSGNRGLGAKQRLSAFSLSGGVMRGRPARSLPMPPVSRETYRHVLPLSMLLLACGTASEVPGAEEQPVAPDEELAGPTADHAQLVLDTDRRALSDTIITGLKHSDPKLRRAATLALARLRRPDALDWLLVALRDTESSVRDAASLGLGALETDAPPAAVEALISALAAEPEPSVRVSMTRDLGRMRTPGALPAIRAALRSDTPEERAAGCIAAAELGLSETGIPGELRARLAALVGAEEPESVRLACAHALSRLPRAFEPSPGETTALTLATSDRHPEVRALAYRALASHPVKPSLLVPGTRDSDWRVAVQAFRSLARRAALESGGATVYAAALREAHARYAAEPGPGGRLHVLLTAFEAAAPIARAGAIHDVASALHEAFGALPEGEPPTRERGLLHCGAAQLLDRARGWPARIENCGHEQVVPAERLVRTAAILGDLAGAEEPRIARLGRLLRERNPTVRQAALAALSRIVDAAATETVLSALSDPDPGVLSAALDAVNRIARRGPTESEVPPPFPVKQAVAALAQVPEAWSEDSLELRVRWLDAVDAVGARALSDEVRALARHPSDAVRSRARSLLAAWREPLPEFPEPLQSNLAPEALLPPEARPRVRFETDRGSIVVELRPDHAPITVARFLDLVRAGFYDGLSFHRVVPGFVVQGGDPRGDGYGGPDHWLRCEDNRLPFLPGTIGMALAGRDTGGSQFFFVLASQPHLEGRYTAFGRVVDGFERLERIHPGDRIRQATVESSTE